MEKNLAISVVQKADISEIVKTHSKRLIGFIKKRVNQAEDAEDLLQEVFHQLVEADRLMKPVDQMAAWLFTVARNRITDFYRKKKPELLPAFESDDEEENWMEGIELMLADNAGNPETEFLRSMVMDELNFALDELPLNQKEVFEMNEIQGLSFKEISEITGEPVNTLISRKRYAVLHLRERLSFLYDELINF